MTPISERAFENDMARAVGKGMGEKEVQRQIVRLLQQCQRDVYSTSQYRPSKVSEGISDLIVFSPRRGVAFIEAKAKGKKQRESQKRFQQARERAGGTYILADSVEKVAQWLEAKR